jgi:hypothetical protein
MFWYGFGCVVVGVVVDITALTVVVDLLWFAADWFAGPAFDDVYAVGLWGSRSTSAAIARASITMNSAVSATVFSI